MRLRQNNCCALVIDYQERLIPAMDKKEDLIANSVRLIKGLALLNIPMLITEQYPKGLGHTIPEIMEAAAGAPVFEKTSFGALGSDDALSHLVQLEEMGRDHVLICGIEAHVCVLQSALQLLRKDCKPVFVTDCITSRHAIDCMTALMRAEKENIQFVTSEMLLFELIGGKEHPQFKEISALVK